MTPRAKTAHSEPFTPARAFSSVPKTSPKERTNSNLPRDIVSMRHARGEFTKTNMNRNYQFTLSDAERDNAYAAFAGIPYDPRGGMDYITAVRLATLKALPHRLLVALSEQKASYAPLPYLVIENLPVDVEVTTTPDPTMFQPDVKSGYVSENLIMGIASLIGEPYSIFFEGACIVNNLVPIPAAAHDFTGLGSEAELAFHVENAALKHAGERNFSPLGLLLTGVRSDPNGPLTWVSDARDAMALLSAADIATLRRPLYFIRVPYRWRTGQVNSPDETHPVAIVKDTAAHPDITAAFYPGMMRCETVEAQEALDRFYIAIKKVGFGLDIKPGRLLYVDNRSTLHSRDAFKSGTDSLGNPLRWVQRVFVAQSLANHRHLTARHPRVFELSPD